VADFAREDWIGDRDIAVLSLLYGCGLRISEALNLNRQDLPDEDMLRVMGKRNKERLVPLLPVVKKAIETYLNSCPYRLPPEGPLFLGQQGKRLNARMIQLAMEKVRGQLGLPPSATPHALRHSFATHLLTAGGICAPFKNCSVMRRLPLRSIIPMWIRPILWMSIIMPIPA